ncbi:MAG: hypothetical protein Q8Q47_09295 [Ignavibacteriaceae bacterium]|nr:hypothetical protein [Ignavibacteriaceae bacterium]
MKKYLYIIALLSITIFLTSCDNDSSSNPSNGKYMPTLNTELTYKTTNLFEIYDEFGRIVDTMEIMENDIISVVKILSVDDSLPGYRDLLRFNVGNSSTWYINNDTAFFAVAYSNPGGDWVFPKMSSKRYLTISEAKEIISMMNKDIAIPNSVLSDSVQYYESPRVVVKYPLYVGQKWVELSLPSFLWRERVVKDVKIVSVAGLAFSCFENVAEISNLHLKITDYFNITTGIIKRVVLSDSVGLSSADNPEITGWGKFTTESILIEKR